MLHAAYPLAAGDALASSKSRLAVDRRAHTPRGAAANQEEILRKRLQRRRTHMDMLTGTAGRRGANSPRSPRAAASGTGDTADASPRTGNEQLLAERHRRQNRSGPSQGSPPGSQVAPISDVVKHGRRAGAVSGRSSEADGASSQPARSTPRRASSMPTASAALSGAGKAADVGANRARPGRRRSLEPMSSRAFSTSRVSPVQASMGRRVASTSCVFMLAWRVCVEVEVTHHGTVYL